MKFYVLLIIYFLFSRLSYAKTEYEPICSLDVNLDFVNLSGFNQRGKWIKSGDNRTRLSFNITEIGAIYVMVLKNFTGDQCDFNSVLRSPRFYLQFNEPFNNKSLVVDIYNKKGDYENGKISYGLFVKTIINGEKRLYFRNFSFNVDGSY